MTLSVEHPEADFPARAPIAHTEESMADASIAGHLSVQSLRNDLRRVQHRYRELPLLDSRIADEILEYDEHGLPL